MGKSQEQTLRTLLVFFIVLGYGTADVDQHHSQDMSWAVQNPKVAIIHDRSLRRQGRDVGQDNNPYDCYPDEYYSDYYRRCKGCTRCSPGTQHDPQEFCGNGQGQEAHCTQCKDGYYQSHEDIVVLTCQPCSICDPHAIIEQTCSQQSNTVCGQCQKGWYYNETNTCLECMERDLTDPSNRECYVKPKPTPGLNPPGPEPRLGPRPDLNPSTKAPVPSGGEDSSKPFPKPTPGHKAVDPQNENALGGLEIGLICGAILCALVLVSFLIYCKQKNKRKNVPPIPDEHEMVEKERLYHVDGDQQRPGSSGETCKPANPLSYNLVPPSSHADSSQHSKCGSSAGTIVDPSQGGEPTLNYVTADRFPQSDNHQDETVYGPLSVAQSLKSWEDSEVPDRPLEGVQSRPGKMDDLSSRVTCNHDEDATGRNYDVAPDESILTEIGSLSSQPQQRRT